MTDKSSDDDERHYLILERLRERRYRWPAWGTLERADSVVWLHNQDLSLRKLAKVAGCCEGTMRNYEILGQVPDYWRQAHIESRFSMRRLVQLVREAQKRVPKR